jgi:predicted PurR-regulated permease PerM
MNGDAQAASLFDTRGTTMSSFILMLVAQVYTKYFMERIQPIPNTRYFRIAKLVCQISGVIACGLLLSVLLPPIWWWIIISPCAFNSIRELNGSYHQICELFNDIYQQISESLHDIYQQISESLHGISAQVFNKLHDAFQWICNTTQQAGPPAFNENSVRQEGERGPPRVQNV